MKTFSRIGQRRCPVPPRWPLSAVFAYPTMSVGVTGSRETSPETGKGKGQAERAASKIRRPESKLTGGICP
ncbi:hypothetical protein ACLB1O_18120 [Escherichia coli]